MIQNEPILRRSDMIRCALCSHAPCDAVCERLAPSGLVRSIWFRNEQGAALRLPEENLCLICDAPCEKACVRTGEVPIKDLINRLYCQVKPECETQLPDNEDRLKCDLCGIPLENPFLLSSLVVASTYDMCARAFEAGWAGACFKTICSLDIHEASPRFSAITGDGGSIVGFKNIEQLSDHSVAENMEIFRRLKAKYPTKFILASIMGQNEAEWGTLSRLIACYAAFLIDLISIAVVFKDVDEAAIAHRRFKAVGPLAGLIVIENEGCRVSIMILFVKMLLYSIDCLLMDWIDIKFYRRIIEDFFRAIRQYCHPLKRFHFKAVGIYNEYCFCLDRIRVVHISIVI